MSDAISQIAVTARVVMLNGSPYASVGPFETIALADAYAQALSLSLRSPRGGVIAVGLDTEDGQSLPNQVFVGPFASSENAHEWFDDLKGLTEQGAS